MKILLLAVLLSCFLPVSAQSDIDVVFLKSGDRIECTIQSISSDSLFISRFSGRSKVLDAYALENVVTYLVNNFYTTPGEDIIRATGHFFTGTTLMVAGGIITVMAVNDGKKDIAVIGTAIGMLGSVFLFSGYSKMNQAGKKMNKLQLQNDRIIYKL